MPPELGIQILDDFEMGSSSLGDDSDRDVSGTIDLNFIEGYRRIIVLFTEVETESRGVGHD